MASSLYGRVSRSKEFTKKTLQNRESIRPISYKNWDDATMEKALEEVSSRSMTIRRAAEEYGVPRSTLGDRASGRVVPGTKSGAPTYLSPEEEEELVHFLIGSAEIGYPKLVREVRTLVGAILSRNADSDVGCVSTGWWERFKKRHPNLSLRQGESLAYKRAIVTNRDVIDKYFDLLEETISKNNLGDRPSCIFNCDESGMPLNFRPGKRIAKKGAKHVLVYGTGVKTQITILACVNAAGYAIPPLVVFKRKNLVKPLMEGEVEGTMYGLSPSGWMDGEIFCDWLERHFLLYAPASRPLLLMLDGHSSHYMADVVRTAASKGVILFCLPPNTTHATQPLDKTCFHALKKHWDDVINTYMTANSGRLVTLYQFNKLFHDAWDKAMIPSTIRAGFKATGVYPVDRYAVKIPGEHTPKRKSIPIEDVAKSNGISYLPLYSPHTSKKRVSFAPSPEMLSPLSLSPLSPVSPETHYISFTAEEKQRFQTRYEEGFDITTDSRYNQWLQNHHPEAISERCQLQFSPLNPDDSLHLEDTLEQGADTVGDKTDLPLNDSSPPCTTNISRKLKLDQFVKLLPPPTTLTKKKPGEARVLTSAEFLLELDKKEGEKKKQAQLKEQRKQVRLEKAATRAAKKATHAASVPKSGPKKGSTTAGSKFP